MAQDYVHVCPRVPLPALDLAAVAAACALPMPPPVCTAHASPCVHCPCLPLPSPHHCGWQGLVALISEMGFPKEVGAWGGRHGGVWGVQCRVWDQAPLPCPVMCVLSCLSCHVCPVMCVLSCPALPCAPLPCLAWCWPSAELGHGTAVRGMGAVWGATELLSGCYDSLMTPRTCCQAVRAALAASNGNPDMALERLLTGV